ncbi:MAG: biopolymer transporter ExbD [Gallionella sp.]|nr:biopolymer transporter ExbD [Gallionella sp.]
MSRRHYYKHKHKEEDIDVTPLLNVMVVLVAFLIFSAVFSRITIQELVLPTQAEAGAAPDKPPVSIEIIVRKDALEIGDGNSIMATIPKLGKKYDIQKLSEILMRLKEQHSEKQDAVILLEPDIEYEYMIQVMDTVKVAEIRKEGQEKPQKVILFPQVSIGDAP